MRCTKLKSKKMYLSWSINSKRKGMISYVFLVQKQMTLLS